jgi:hypothetical protein
MGKALPIMGKLGYVLEPTGGFVKLRTVTRQNGADDVSEREMHFGWDVIGTLGGFVLAAFAAWLSLRLDVQEIKTQQRIEHEGLPDVIDLRVRQMDDSVIQRVEFESHTHQGTVPAEH